MNRPARRTASGLQEGDVVAERYRIVGRLGEGGMAEVFRVEDLEAGGQRALKVLHPDIATKQEAVDRTMREGEVLSALNNPAIVSVERFDKLPDGRVYLVMELLEGETLAERMARGPMEPEELTPIVTGTCAGLHAAHVSGVVHRDLKPENVFLCPTKFGVQVKLLDFGISKVFGSARLTQTGEVLGTPRYMSPEQLGAEKDVDGRIDTYSVGVILYQALAGRPPFAGSTPTDLIVAILHGNVTPLTEVRPEISEKVAAVVMKAFRSDRTERYANARDLAEAYVDAIGGVSTVRRNQARNQPTRAFGEMRSSDVTTKEELPSTRRPPPPGRRRSRPGGRGAPWDSLPWGEGAEPPPTGGRRSRPGGRGDPWDSLPWGEGAEPPPEKTGGMPSRPPRTGPSEGPPAAGVSLAGPPSEEPGADAQELGSFDERPFEESPFEEGLDPTAKDSAVKRPGKETVAMGAAHAMAIPEAPAAPIERGSLEAIGEDPTPRADAATLEAMRRRPVAPATPAFPTTRETPRDMVDAAIESIPPAARRSVPATALMDASMTPPPPSAPRQSAAVGREPSGMVSVAPPAVPSRLRSALLIVGALLAGALSASAVILAIHLLNGHTDGTGSTPEPDVGEEPDVDVPESPHVEPETATVPEGLEVPEGPSETAESNDDATGSEASDEREEDDQGDEDDAPTRRQPPRRARAPLPSVTDVANDPVRAARDALRGGDPERCVRLLDEAIRSGTPSTTLRRRAECHEAAGHRAAAIADYQRFCRLATDHPTIPDVRAQLARWGASCP